MVPWNGKSLMPMPKVTDETVNWKYIGMLSLSMCSLIQPTFSHLKNTSKYRLNRMKFILQHSIQYLNGG